MTFAYYKRLTREQKTIYRKSAAVQGVRLPNAPQLRPGVLRLAAAMKQQDRERIQTLCQQLALGITTGLAQPPVTVKVLAVRPHDDWGELHGLYQPAEGRARAVITVWMRTAQRRQVVAFRSFLRTLLHEICHHLDYTLLKLADSYHTEGFYMRESNLFHQLVDAAPRRSGAA